MPFSRSRSIESMTRSLTSWFWRKAPDCQSMASTSVVFPWSTWATIATLRRSERTAMRELKLAGRHERAHCFRRRARHRQRMARARPEIDDLRVARLAARGPDRRGRVMDLRIRARRVAVLEQEAVANPARETSGERASQCRWGGGGDRLPMHL